MWSTEKLNLFRDINNLPPLSNQEAVKVKDVLNDMKKDLDKVDYLTNEPMFCFSNCLLKNKK